MKYCDCACCFIVFVVLISIDRIEQVWKKKAFFLTQLKFTFISNLQFHISSQIALCKAAGVEVTDMLSKHCPLITAASNIYSFCCNCIWLKRIFIIFICIFLSQKHLIQSLWNVQEYNCVDIYSNCATLHLTRSQWLQHRSEFLQPGRNLKVSHSFQAAVCKTLSFPTSFEKFPWRWGLIDTLTAWQQALDPCLHLITCENQSIQKALLKLRYISSVEKQSPGLTAQTRCSNILCLVSEARDDLRAASPPHTNRSCLCVGPYSHSNGSVLKEDEDEPEHMRHKDQKRTQWHGRTVWKNSQNMMYSSYIQWLKTRHGKKQKKHFPQTSSFVHPGWWVWNLQARKVQETNHI